MRIAKCLIIVLVSVAVVFGAERRLSNTRTASCIVRITVDPEIIPLTPQTVNHLLLSSGIAGKAGMEVFGLDADTAWDLHEGVEIEWLAQSNRQVGQRPMSSEPGKGRGQASRSTGQSRDEGYDDMMRQLAEIYGDRYVERVEQSSSKNSAPEKGSSQTHAPGIIKGGGMMGGGGMGGGMMGGRGMGDGYGGMMRGMYGGPMQATSAPGTQQSVTLRLLVDLPGGIEPGAEEYLAALVENLRQALLKASERHEGQIAELLQYKEYQRDSLQERLEEVIGAKPKRTGRGTQLEQTLQTIVDLSMLSPGMPFSEAIEILRNAVEPPLPIVVMWKELLDSCDIEPTTPIDMDGLPSVKLETALRTLIEAVSGGFADLSYQIDDDVIVIREEELQEPQPMPTGPNVEVDVRDLVAQRRALARRLQQLEMNFATTEARREAIERQINRTRHEAAERMEADSVAQEMGNLVEMSQKHLEALARQVETGRLGATELAKARENLTRAKIELARRREELANSAGGSQLKEFNSELSRMAIDTAEKRAELEFLRRQLAETEDQLAQASTFDPRTARIRIAREMLDVADAQVTKLNARLAGLQRPTVAVIGAN
jgi:hypothetical protein